MGASRIPIAIAVLVVLGIGAYFVYGPKAKPPAEPVLTADAKRYLEHLALSDVGMQAADSAINISLTEISGKITNNGQRQVGRVLVNCVFRDVYGQPIKRERVTIAGPKTGPLAPGSTKTFHLNFDDIPQSWNQAMPDLVIAEILFQ